MKNKKIFLSFVILSLIFSAIIIGCSNKSNNLKSENQILKTQNDQLKDKVLQLEKSISDLKLTKENINTKTLSILYTEVNDKVRFIEKENYILALPQSDVEIKAGSDVYKTFEFKDIKTTTHIKLAMNDRGRLQEKKDGYCRISQAGEEIYG